MTIENIYCLTTTNEDRNRVMSAATYHGISKKDVWLRLIVSGVKMWGDGTLFHAVKRPGPQPIVAKSGMYQPDALLDKGMFCYGKKTGKLYWFYGQLKPVAVKILVTEDQSPTAVFKPMALTAEIKPETESKTGTAPQPQPEPQLQSICSVICCSAGDADCPPSVEALPVLKCEAHACAEFEQVSAGRLDTPAHKSVAARQAKFQQELARATQICATGLDPHVDLKFMIAYLPTTRATAYRKIKLGTSPRQIKRAVARFGLSQ